MLRRVALVKTDVLEELSASFISVTRIGGLGTSLAVTSNRHTLRFPQSEWIPSQGSVPQSPQCRWRYRLVNFARYQYVELYLHVSIRLLTFVIAQCGSGQGSVPQSPQ
jgi:hypothetical protein